MDLRISQQQLTNFVNQHYPKYTREDPCPVGYALKKYLKFEIETKLTNNVPSQGFEQIDHVRIADIQFSYKNAALIELLNKRGEAIKANDWKALKNISQQLDKTKTRHF